MSVRGDHKPIPVIEDVSVPVEHLAEYVGAIEDLVADSWHDRGVLRPCLGRLSAHSTLDRSQDG